jgi:hypothetical protein
MVLVPLEDDILFFNSVSTFLKKGNFVQSRILIFAISMTFTFQRMPINCGQTPLRIKIPGVPKPVTRNSNWTELTLINQR